MKIIIYQNREVYKENSKIGNDLENKVETLEFEFPEEYKDFTKYIEFQIKDEKYVDLIENDMYIITRSIAKFGKIKAQIVLRNSIENDVAVFKSDVFELKVSKSINATIDVPIEYPTWIDNLTRLNQNLEKSEIERVSNEEIRQSLEKIRQENFIEMQKTVESATSNIKDLKDDYNENAKIKIAELDSNFVEKQNTINDTVEEKIELFNTDFTEKIKEFNNNSETKFNDYNSNSNGKLSEYDKNHTNKMKEYDDNATAKLNAYNKNDIDKTNAYDANDIAKTKAYNDNTVLKEKAYNDNATSKTDAFNINAVQRETEFKNLTEEKINEYNTNHINKTKEFNNIISPNLYNPTDAKQNVAIAQDNGTEISFDGWLATGYIKVNNGDILFFSNNDEPFPYSTGAFYDSNKHCVTAFGNPNNNNNTTITADGYARFSFNNIPDKLQIEKNERTPYIPFGELVISKDVAEVQEKVTQIQEDAEKVQEDHTNLFNKYTVTKGAILPESGYFDSSFTAWDCSDFIPVEPKTELFFSSNQLGCGVASTGAYYDKNKKYILPLKDEPLSITIPDNAYYIRFSKNGRLRRYCKYFKN